MKKLKNLKLDALKEVLSREQMKKITGGYSCPGQPCSFTVRCCPTWHCCSLTSQCVSPQILYC
ncbi:MAG: TIGR04149 family rSAM-modified RiPP [Bacteroidetes bacterium]|nr:TIGR04149 family rSAM-modified RiPP [Bacteroidota bacterium]